MFWPTTAQTNDRDTANLCAHVSQRLLWECRHLEEAEQVQPSVGAPGKLRQESQEFYICSRSIVNFGAAWALKSCLIKQPSPGELAQGLKAFGGHGLGTQNPYHIAHSCL